MNLWDDDDDDTDSPEENMGDLTYTPMYTYVYNYRPPPAYTEVPHFWVPTSSGNHGKPGKSLKKSSMHGKIMEIEKPE